MLNLNQNCRFLAVSAGILFFSNLGFAQQSSGFTPKGVAATEMPEVVCYPNPASAGNPLTIKLAEIQTTNFESETISVRIADEHGRVLFSAELPDELEFTPPADRFPKGNYYLQYYQNGRLFQTEELRIE